MISTFLLSLLFGFLAASIVHPIFHKIIRFRAEWRGTFVACIMTSLVFGMTLVTATISYDRKGDFYLLLVLSTTAALAFVAGLLSFRLIIRSESGRSLNLLTSGIVSGLLVLPLALLGLLVELAKDTP